MTTRRNRRVQPRPRVYEPRLRAHDSNTANVRQSLVTPGKGKRLRILRVRAIQESADGRRLYEVYFGTGEDIGSDPSKAVDTLDIPELGEDSTRIISPRRGSSWPAGRAAQRALGRSGPGNLPQDHHRIYRGELEEMIEGG